MYSIAGANILKGVIVASIAGVFFCTDDIFAFLFYPISGPATHRGQIHTRGPPINFLLHHKRVTSDSAPHFYLLAS
jgi:hypothetical protein